MRDVLNVREKLIGLGSVDQKVAIVRNAGVEIITLVYVTSKGHSQKTNNAKGLK